MKYFRFVACLILSACSITALANTHSDLTVLFDTFGTGSGFINQGYTIKNQRTGVNQFGVGFTTNTTISKLHAFDIPIGLTRGPSELTLRLVESAPGPYSSGQKIQESELLLIEEYQVTGEIPLYSDPTSIMTVHSVVKPTLEAGHQYWLLAQFDGFGAIGGWHATNIPFSEQSTFKDGIFRKSNDGEWQHTVINPWAAIRVIGHVIPEPSSAAMAIIASVTMLAVRKKIFHVE